ncbi:phosphotransferase [Streptomyces sp. NPDC002537]
MAQEGFWREKFAREAAAYHAFARSTPPVHLPRLLGADAQAGIVILERMPGQPLHTERCPPVPLQPSRVRAAVDTVGRLAHWRPAPGAFTQVWDYPQRFQRYHGYGLLDTDDHRALAHLLDTAGADRHFAHGDPLPANILINTRPDERRHDVSLIDWEFAGYYLPHLDWALLWVLLASDPSARVLIEERVHQGGPARAAAFTVNTAMVLTRELRTHRDELPAPWAQRRLDGLERDWTALRARLHRDPHPRRP